MARKAHRAQPPRAPRLTRDLAAVPGGELLEGDPPTEFGLEGVRGRGLVLAGALLDEFNLLDVQLDSSDLANLQAPRVSWMRVALRDCRLTGLGLTEGQLSDLTVENCRVDLAALRFARLTRVVFRDCLLAQADLYGARLQSTRFERCDLRGAEFSSATLERCEFSACRLEDLSGVASMAGASMTWPDLVQLTGALASAVGIGLLEEQ